MYRVLIHLSGGLGDVVMATPAISALADKDHMVDVLIEGDFVNIFELFSSWSPQVNVSNDRADFETKKYDYYLIGWIVTKPILFNKYQTVILSLEYSVHLPKICLSQSDLILQAAKAIDPSINLYQETYCGYSQRKFPEISSKTVVLYCGCKILFSIKRWNHFAELANRFLDVAVVGVPEDIDGSYSYSYPSWVFKYFHKYLKHKGKLKFIFDCIGKKNFDTPKFGRHVKNYIGKLSLSDTAALINQAGLFIGNDGGLSHVSAAVGTPTVVIFGPSALEMVRINRKNVFYLSKKLDCQPCQFGGKYPNAWKYLGVGCPIDLKCLNTLSVDEVYTKSVYFLNKLQSSV